MVGGKDKKRKSNVTQGTSGPSASATAPAPSTSQAKMAAKASASKQQRQASPGPPQPGILGRPELSDEFSEPESSLFDYQQMDDAGYSTVGFGTWPAQGRSRKQGPPETVQFSTGSYGIYSEPGGLEGQGQGDHTMAGSIADLYATPMKKKSSMKAATSNRGAEGDGISLSRTHQDVQAEMQRIHDLPQEIGETMSRSSRQNVHISATYPPVSNQADSGRGSSRRDSLEEDTVAKAAAATATEEDAKNEDLSPDLALIADKMTQSRKKKALQSFSSSLRRGGSEDEEETSGARKPADIIDNEEVQRLLLETETVSRTHSQPSRLSGRSSSTPRAGGGTGFLPDMEMQQLRLQNEEMLSELMSLRRVAEAIRDGDVESAQALHARRQVEELKEENETLKTTVHRLNVELSDLQAKYRPVDPALVKQAKEVHGLPTKGPIPSWLISRRYLAPLFLAYDDHLERKDEVIEECKAELASLRKRAEDVLKENQKLRLLGGGFKGQGDSTEWHQLKEQAKLVLEENQILMERLEVQTLKSKDMYTTHIGEISRMAKKLAFCEGEKADRERELDDIKLRYKELKHKHDQTLLDMGSQVNVHTHINSISDLKRSVTEEKENVRKEVEAIKIKLKASEKECKSQALHMIDLDAENRKLKAEVEAMQKSVARTQQKMLVLHRAVELSEDKEMVTQEQLANVIKVAEKTALERDTVYKVAREQQEESKLTVSKLMKGSVTVGKLEEQLK
ncbi:centrosomal protein of 89 kDa, partial [Elysia marginata]